MHIVRSLHGVYEPFLLISPRGSSLIYFSISSRIYIDQVDIDVKNICSAFSYCVSILDTLFVWHGCGSPSIERQAAMDYGRTLTSSPDDIVVLIENENDDDEMFWMVLGEEANYAKADYWKWRSSIGFTPRIWSIEAGRKDPVHIFLRRFHSLPLLNGNVAGITGAVFSQGRVAAHLGLSRGLRF